MASLCSGISTLNLAALVTSMHKNTLAMDYVLLHNLSTTPTFNQDVFVKEAKSKIGIFVEKKFVMVYLIS